MGTKLPHSRAKELFDYFARNLNCADWRKITITQNARFAFQIDRCRNLMPNVLPDFESKSLCSVVGKDTLLFSNSWSNTHDYMRGFRIIDILGLSLCKEGYSCLFHAYEAITISFTFGSKIDWHVFADGVFNLNHLRLKTFERRYQDNVPIRARVVSWLSRVSQTIRKERTLGLAVDHFPQFYPICQNVLRAYLQNK